MEDYYKLLGIDKGSFNQEKLISKYNQLIAEIDEDIEKNSLNEEKVSELKKLKDTYIKAYETLSDSGLKTSYDFRLSLEVLEDLKETNQPKTKFPSDNYANIIKRMFYKKEDGENIELYDKKNMRMIEIEQKGNLYFETKMHYKNAGDPRYKVTVKKLFEDEGKDALVFTSIDKRKMESDEEYRKFVTEELLSDKNLEFGVLYNGGYIGEIGEKDGKYTIEYNEETLCAVMDFSMSRERYEIDMGKKNEEIVRISTRDDREKKANERIDE